MTAPNCCPRCLRNYEWETDGPFGIGKVRPRHPMGPCVPPPPFKPDDDEIFDLDPGYSLIGRRRSHFHKRKPDRNAKPRICANDDCDKTFLSAFSRTRTCSPKCSYARRQQNRRAYYDRTGEKAKVQAMRRERRRAA